MTTIRKERLPVWAAKMNGESTLPLLYDLSIPGEPGEFATDEEDGLWLNFRGVRTAFPYRSQDCYDRNLSQDGIDGVILENEHLRASFAPGAGGKLWSLYDKDEGRELLFANHVFRPAYLALRNAWASGGVEWNCGAYTGHHPHTCSPMFTALISAEESGIGCPVLRMYNFERIRNVTYQMDFYLPEDAKLLHCRMRVVNENYTAEDMYWWSNIAVPSDPEARCVVPADFAFTHANGMVSRVPVPEYQERDISYPTHNPVAVDYFFKTYDNHRHYTSHLNKEGYGLVQTSTSRLKGRKLFVWGQGQGGAKWQEFLSGDDGHGKYGDGKYCEIQCGLAHSQYECLPMPPKTAWEWVEYYGPMHADPEKVHGEWHGAQAELEAKLDALIPLDEAEQELIDTRPMAKKHLGTLILSGEGWAALENERRAKRGMTQMAPHLDFGTCGAPQRMWQALLRTGSLYTAEDSSSAVAPLSYQRGTAWMKLLEAAVKGPDRYYWLAQYELACTYFAEGDLVRAEEAFDASCKLEANAWNLYGIAELYRVKGDLKRAASTMLAAARMAPTDASLCKMTARTLHRAGMWDALTDFTASLPAEMFRLPRIRLYRAIALERSGALDEAEAILTEDGGLEIPDIQEGEISVTELWFSIAEKKAARDGVPFDRKTAKPPKKFDFRMFVAD